MANASLNTQARGYVSASLELNQTNHNNTKFLVMPNLCCDVILGHNFLRQLSAINLPLRSSKPALNICCLATINV